MGLIINGIYLIQKRALAKEYFTLYNSTTFGYDIVNVHFYYPWIEKLEKL
jgi:hypothetical protein